MKRHFLTGLKALAVSALAFAAVSCYDDALVWEEIDGLKDRVTALETKLNSEVATINTTLGTLAAADKKLADELAAVVADVKKTNDLVSTLDAYDKTIDGKIEDLDAALAALEDEATKQLAAIVAQIAVVKAEKNEAGNYVITFADGKTLEVADNANSNNTGVITTVEVEGVTYWAVIGADGKTTVLDAAVHPDTKLEFKVDPKTNELLVAYDGKTWEKTGVIVNDDTTINVVSDFVDGDDYVTITVGGKEYMLPKYTDFTSAEFDRDAVYVPYGATRTVNLTIEEGHEYYVTSKPDGWKAVLDGSVLTVTAPSEDIINVGAGELTGEVLVHTDAASGACKIVKLDVKAGPSMTLTYENGNVTFFNAAIVYHVDEMYGETWAELSDAWFGLIPVKDFIEYGTFEAYAATEPEALANLQTILFNKFQDEYYESGKDEFEATWSLKEIVANSDSGFEYDEEETYLMWVAPAAGYSYDYDNAIYLLTGQYIEWEETEVATDEVEFETYFFGADSYIVGAIAKSSFDEWGINEEFTYEMALKEYMMQDMGFPMYNGPFINFLSGNKSAMGTEYPVGANTINLSDFVYPVDSNSEYFVWVLPFYETKDFADYKYEDLILYDTKTAKLVENNAVAATVAISEVTYDKFTYSITPVADASFFFEVMTAEAFNAEYVVDDEIDDDALYMNFKNGWPQEEAVEETDTYSYEDGVYEYVLVTYSMSNGYYAVTVDEISRPLPAHPNNVQYKWFDDTYGMDRFFDLNRTDEGVLYIGSDYDVMTQGYPEEYLIPELVGKIQAEEKYENVKIVPMTETSGRITMKVTRYNPMFDEEETFNYLILYSDYTETSVKLYSPSTFEGEDAAYSGIGLCAFDAKYNTLPVEVTLVESPKDVVFMDNSGIGGF